MSDSSNSNAHPVETRKGFNGLVASAFVLVGLIVVQTDASFNQPFKRANVANAGMVSQTRQLTVMTADAGAEDLMLVLEGRSEELLVYRTDRNGMQLQQRLSIPKMFQDARAMAQGH